MQAYMQEKDLSQLEKQLENRLHAKDRRKRKRMQQSGKQVFALRKLINKKNG